jgi:hypothetical protein
MFGFLSIWLHVERRIGNSSVLMVDSSSAGVRERYLFGRMERKEEGEKDA